MMVFLLSFRYMFSRSNRHRSRVIRIMAGLAISTMVMLSIISLMDYMQSRGTEPLREIKSFPLVVDVSDAQDVSILCEKYSGIAEVFPYKEEKALLSDSSGTRGVVIRYIDESYDGALVTSTDTVPQNGIYLPFRSYVRGFSDSVSITTLVQGRAVRMIPRTRTYAVEGLYQTTLSDFDSLYVFLPLSMSDETLGWKVAFRNINADEDDLASLEENIRECYSEITKTSEQINMSVREEFISRSEMETIQKDFETSITQSSTEIRMDFTTITDEIKENVSTNQLLLEEYIRFKGALIELGKVGNAFTAELSRFKGALIELGKVGNAFTAELSNEELAFKENGQKIAYISNQSLVITNAEIRNKLSLGNESRGWFDFIPRTNGNLSIKWRGPV